MDTNERVYRNLQQHLDKQAVGYPATKSGAELRVLKRLFSPEEAQLVMHLNYKPMTLERIYKLAKDSGLSFENVENMLTTMAKNSVIGLVEKEEKRFFHTIPSASACSRGN
jgi:Na+-translocating ferredoxin:NAD+ oxidoreductase subunit B